MKIVQVSTYDISGGAARAAYRLQKGLREIGQDSRMLVRHKNTEDVYVHAVSAEMGVADEQEAFFLEAVIQEHYINAHRTKMSNTLFSLPYPGYDIARVPALNEADVINLHWVAQYQSPMTLRNLCSLGKPVVWTLHDQWAFTGGCHYSGGCENYQSDCARCPQLSEDLSYLSGAVLKDKLDLLEGVDLTFVTPSRWMAGCVRKSRLFSDHRVVVIPNSLELDVFTPLSKDDAKEALGLEKDTLTILFGGEDANERRKGFPELILAINYLTERIEFKALIEMKKVRLLCFGRPSGELSSMNIPIVSLGYLGSDLEIRNAYCAADVFVLPSLEDNLPNTVLEAMSCGTSVVGFKVGGLPDMVENDVTGRLVPAGDTAQLGEAMLSLLLDSTGRQRMGEKCRQKVELEYPLRVQASRYSALYEELISQNKARTPAGIAETNELELMLFGGNLSVSAPLESSVGPHFQMGYDSILLKALKESAFDIYRNWQDAEVDRAARLQVIQDQGKRIVDLEAEVDRWLSESKRLQDHANDLLFQQKELEKNLAEERKTLGDRIVDIEADRATRLQVINEQGRRIAGLEYEVDRWLNENRRLRKACSEIEQDRNELKLKIQRLEGNPYLRGLKTYLSNLSSHMREALLVLNDVKDKRFKCDVALKRLLKDSLTKGREPRKHGGEQGSPRISLTSFSKRIDAFNASQDNHGMLDGIRLFNHSMVDQFDAMFRLKGCLFLDVGASPHGYALERALMRGVALYAGVGLDISEAQYVSGEGNNVGMLINMNAVDLKFPNAMFDAIFSISAFEHILDVARALEEMRRVLRVGGRALISFEPIWSCSYGHHLHHFAGCSELVPPWGHLIWSPDQMRDYLAQKWPSNGPLSLDEAIDWIYHEDSINRFDIRQFKQLLDHCGLTIKWCIDLKDDQKKCDPVWFREVRQATGLRQEELMTKGLCVLLSKGTL